ncbi:hypothetical protein TOPH_07716 [Tolypocladium ophioglossoides CBS 100239]|uniref:Uncharacterized protein n=1 Tax=Tolypocladium ophioglossoides (strain CBS 100239) TaxID=1163406 RepID=A0A0L0N0Q8_TOLOC|nr:hypothetical protein TOPH_07716 [Tolypocladium ophioglossoides CBS 100239]
MNSHRNRVVKSHHHYTNSELLYFRLYCFFSSLSETRSLPFRILLQAVSSIPDCNHKEGYFCVSELYPPEKTKFLAPTAAAAVPEASSALNIVRNRQIRTVLFVVGLATISNKSQKQ